MPTPNTVNGIARSRNIRNSRQTPARDPYSYSDSIDMWRAAIGAPPTISERNVSDAASPWSTQFSPPSS